MAFDEAGARAAGYSDEEIAEEKKRAAKEYAAAQEEKFAAELTKKGGTGSFLENAAAGAGGALTDMVLGGRQAIDAITGGKNKEALDKEAAEKLALDKPLSRTAGGIAGNLATQAATAAIPFGAATRGAAMIPRALPWLTTPARALLPGAAVGAGQGVLTPDADYTLGGQAAKGAALGAAGDVAGRAAGFALRPMRRAVDPVVDQFVARVREGLPNARLIAENLSGSDYIKSLSNTLAQIPIAGGGIKRTREHNLGEVTDLVTGTTGTRARALTPDVSETLHGRLENQANAFRQGPPLSVPGMPAALAQASNDAQMGARLLGTNQPMRQSQSAYGAIVPPPPAMPPGIPQPPPVVRRIPADTAMDVRRELGDQVFQQQHGLASRGAEAIKDEIENALRRRHGNDFDRWLAEHGGSLDVRKVQAAKNAVSPRGGIRPEEFRRIAMSEREIADPSNPFYRTMGAAAERMATPPLTENRSLMARILMGAALPGTGAAIGGVLGDEGGAEKGALAGLGTLGAAAWLLGSPGGSRYLLGQNRSAVGRALQSDRAQEIARLLGITALD